MSCEAFERLVSDRLGESLTPADERRLEEHLSQCEACAEEAQLAEDAVEAARMPAPSHEERAAISRLRDPIAIAFRLGAQRPADLRRTLLRWSVPWVGAAIAAGLVLTISFHQPGHQPGYRSAVAADDGDELVAWAMNDPSAELLAPSESGSEDDLANALSDDGVGDLGGLSNDDDGVSMKHLMVALCIAGLSIPALSWAGAQDQSFDKDLQDKRMHTMRTVGLAEMLNLSEADALKLSETLRPFDEQKRPLHEQMKTAAQILRRAAQGEAIPSAQVDDATNKIFDARTQMAAIDRAQFTAITKGMSSQDRAKVAVFFAKFQQGMHHGDGQDSRGIQVIRESEDSR